jgi:hypothetical protein
LAAIFEGLYLTSRKIIPASALPPAVPHFGIPAPAHPAQGSSSGPLATAGETRRFPAHSTTHRLGRSA